MCDDGTGTRRSSEKLLPISRYSFAYGRCSAFHHGLPRSVVKPISTLPAAESFRNARSTSASNSARHSITARLTATARITVSVLPPPLAPSSSDLIVVVDWRMLLLVEDVKAVKSVGTCPAISNERLLTAIEIDSMTATRSLSFSYGTRRSINMLPYRTRAHLTCRYGHCLRRT